MGTTSYKFLPFFDFIRVCTVCLDKNNRVHTGTKLEGFLEKTLKIKSALKSTGKSLKSLEKSLNSIILFRTKQCR